MYPTYLRGSNERGISDSHSVVHLVLVLQTPKNKQDIVRILQCEIINKNNNSTKGKLVILRNVYYWLVC